MMYHVDHLHLLLLSLNQESKMNRRFFCFVILSLAVAKLISSDVGTIVCRCGGQYADNKPVKNCISETCQANVNESVHCVTIRRPTRENAVIGYDCVKWPESFPSTCANFDDGSRLCVNDTCQSTNGSEPDKCKIRTNSAHAYLDAQLTPSGINFALQGVRALAADKIKNLSIPDQTIREAGQNITIYNINIQKFLVPDLSVALEPPSSIELQIDGGDFKVCAQWRAFMVLAPLIHSSGNLCVSSEKSKGINGQIDIKTIVTPTGRIQLDLDSCNIDVPVDMNFTGIVGTAIEIVTDLLHGLIRKKMDGDLCKAIEKLVNEDVNTLLGVLPTSFDIDKKLGLGADIAIQSVVVSEGGVKAEVAVNATVNS